MTESIDLIVVHCSQQYLLFCLLAENCHTLLFLSRKCSNDKKFNAISSDRNDITWRILKTALSTKPDDYTIGEVCLTHSHTMTHFDAPGKQAF